MAHRLARQRTSPHKSKLQRDAVSRKHEGLLTCEAANYHGSNKMSLQLTVHGKPSMPEVTCIRHLTVSRQFSPVLDISSRILASIKTLFILQLKVRTKKA